MSLLPLAETRIFRRRLFPTLAPAHADGSKLKGTIVYFDGQVCAGCGRMSARRIMPALLS
jgi:hypothetical protein